MSERFVLNETSIFGRGCRSELPREIKGRGYKKVFLVTDKGLVNCGLIKKVTDVLDEAKIDYTLYSEVKPNPSIKNALDGYGICKKIKADVIVAVGGGSAIDTAKCIAILMKNPDRADVKSLNGLSNTKNKGLPMIALPTTHGTAAEVTINYVITDEDAQVKMVCVDPHDIPLLAIVDSELMESLPKMTAAATGLDALTHAVEGYITKAHNTMSDMFHMKAIELIFENLPAAVNEKNKKAIENMALAQYIAGMGFSNVGLGIVHSMAHPLGAFYDTPHGVANALLLPYVMEYNAESPAAPKYIHIAKAMGVDTTGMSEAEGVKAAIEAVKALSISINIPQKLHEINVKEEDIPALAVAAFNDVCTGGNPRPTSVAEIEVLYRKAF